MADFERLFEQVSSRLGGRSALADILGVSQPALSNYVSRGSFPQAKFAVIDAALHQQGWQIDLQTMTVIPYQRQQQTILLIITGGIAAYKALELARRLMDRGYLVRAVLTEGAKQFITPLSASALTGQPVYSELFSLTEEAEMGHIRLAREADLVLIAPATAHFVAKIAHGLADCLASTLCLATTAPLLIAPAMNPVMWAHPATQDNLALLTRRGCYTVSPDEGDTACGEVGTGRLAETSQIIAEADRILSPKPRSALAGKHVLVTSGPTYEPIDPVRYIANRSSGKQGHALASELASRGADVVLVSGPVCLPDPEGVEIIHVETAVEMREACLSSFPCDIAICAAAVGDWHVTNPSSHKTKKTDAGPPTLQLATNPDILHACGTHPDRPELVIGFAAETDNLLAYATAKRQRKSADWIIANQVISAEGHSVFGADDNQVSLVTSDGVEEWPQMTKAGISAEIVNRIEAYFTSSDGDAE